MTFLVHCYNYFFLLLLVIILKVRRIYETSENLPNTICSFNYCLINTAFPPFWLKLLLLKWASKNSHPKHARYQIGPIFQLFNASPQELVKVFLSTPDIPTYYFQALVIIPMQFCTLISRFARNYIYLIKMFQNI